MDIELLYPRITEAIRRAETLEDRGAPGARPAYLEVSRLEQKVAEILPASNPEGAVARRGAVRAALSAGEPARAQQLAKQFLSENDAEDELRAELRQLSDQAELSLADRPSRRTTPPKPEKTARTSPPPAKRELRRT